MQKIFKELSQKISDSELQFSNLKFSSLLKFKTEILAGLTVALALVPEAVSFSFVAVFCSRFPIGAEIQIKLGKV